MGATVRGAAHTYMNTHTHTHIRTVTVFRPPPQAPQDTSGHGSGNCMLWLFPGALVDTPGKYAGAIIGTFLLAVAMEVGLQAA